MNIYIYKNDQQVGPLDESQLSNALNNGQFSLDDLAWHEGLTEWVQLREVVKKPQENPAPFSLPESVSSKIIQALTRQEFDAIGWICFSLGVILLFISQGYAIYIYAPFFIASFILSILAMVRRKVIKGVSLMVCALVFPFTLNHFISVNQFVKQSKIKIVKDNMHALRSILVMASCDAAMTGSNAIGYPADINAGNVNILKQSLVQNGYIKSEDWDKLFKDFDIANVSEKDSSDTIRACWSESSNNMIVITAEGDAFQCKKNDAKFKLPPRSPSFLEK